MNSFRAGWVIIAGWYCKSTSSSSARREAACSLQSATLSVRSDERMTIGIRSDEQDNPERVSQHLGASDLLLLVFAVVIQALFGSRGSFVDV